MRFNTNITAFKKTLEIDNYVELKKIGHCNIFERFIQLGKHVKNSNKYKHNSFLFFFELSDEFFLPSSAGECEMVMVFI